jgi:drug/metabolite transporter (DMT)-like permease
MPERAPHRGALVGAFAALYLIWGSTYLAIRIAIESLPPLLMVGSRYLVAGALLYAFVRARGAPAPERRHWWSASLIGALLMMMGNGGVVLAERTIASGVVALLVATVSLWMTLLDWARPGGRRPRATTFVGIALGLAGVVVLVGPWLAGGEGIDPVGVALVMLGSVAWAAGSIYARSAPLPKATLLGTAMQMLAGGLWLTMAGIATGEWTAIDPATFTLRSVAAWGYLVVFGSLIGYTSYVWLLGVTSPARVSTYAFVNPVVAVLLGWALAGEPLSARVLLSAGVIVLAVALITTGTGSRRDRDGARESVGALRRAA